MVREVAATKIIDQTILKKVASEDKNEAVRKKAVTKLTDPTALAKIAVTDDSWMVRESAVVKLTNKAELAKIAVTDEDWTVRKAAVRKLTDQAELAKIAVTDDSWMVRKAATERLIDPNLLGKIAVEDKDERVRIVARHEQWFMTGNEKAILDYGEYLINKSDYSDIPEMIHLLTRTRSKDLAELYVNCGNEELIGAAYSWANKNNFTISSANRNMNCPQWKK